MELTRVELRYWNLAMQLFGDEAFTRGPKFEKYLTNRMQRIERLVPGIKESVADKSMRLVANEIREMVRNIEKREKRGFQHAPTT